MRIAVDDFGIGYSSLASLWDLPVDLLKVDRTFLTGADERHGGRALLQSIVEPGTALDLTPIIEGIERDDQLEVVRRAGYTRGQGFRLGRPLPAHAAEGRLLAA
jgi:EAL domain-containing protein (putative c-di-GMP-specific phosphodiesterase class I)